MVPAQQQQKAIEINSNLPGSVGLSSGVMFSTSSAVPQITYKQLIKKKIII